ncbi:MAG: coproporphyrinogen III oxidase [Myxococcales bacterium]|nr:coproporphyrinogen III oxidase [Myxococcales bacterium]
MQPIPPSSPEARRTLTLVQDLQRTLVEQLQASTDSPGAFAPVTWLRDDGRHGGGTRWQAAGGAFDRASVNVSAVHYDDLPDKRLRCATALSAIVHPAHPHAPSVHTHISHTQMRDGSGYWRLMADLNPSIPHDADTAAFREAIRAAAPSFFDDAVTQGDRYFHIPVLERHRGAFHFYVEGHDSGSFDADAEQASAFGRAVIAAYGAVLQGAHGRGVPPTEADDEQQRHYHTVYLFQVLTLDRGTTSGLLVHADNDVGILGSLPSTVDAQLLASWIPRMPPPQDALLTQIVAALGPHPVATVGEAEKRRLAAAVRAHYQAHPEALAMQASGAVVPPTVDNHR